MSVGSWWECDSKVHILGENVCFFPLVMGRRSFMNEGTWPNTMTSGFDTRERNQQGEHELASGSANASVSEPTFNRRPWCLLAVGPVPGEETDGDHPRERHFLQPGGSANQTESVLLCWVCMLADELRLASRASMPSRPRQASMTRTRSGFQNKTNALAVSCEGFLLWNARTGKLSRIRRELTTVGLATMLRWQLIFCTHSWAADQTCHSDSGARCYDGQRWFFSSGREIARTMHQW